MDNAGMIGLRFPKLFQDFRGLQLPGVILVGEIDCFEQCQSVERGGLRVRGVPRKRAIADSYRSERVR